MSSEKTLTRRTLLKSAVFAAPAVATGCATITTITSDGEPLVQPTDPVARAVGYFANTGDVPAAHPLAETHSVEQKCANCIHGRGSAGPGRIECPTFPGRSVNEDGWCSIWAPRI